MRNQSAPSYIPGLTTSRLREATGVLGAGLLFALAPSMVILAPALQTHDLAASLRNFLTVSEGFRVTSISTLTFIGSSVLILGLTYALMDRRRLDVDTHVQNERRFSTIARIACLVAIPFAALALPSTFTRLDYVGDAAAIICVLALTVTFAFGAGTSWVTDARQQKASVEATQHSAKRRLERATRVPVPPLGHARLQLVLRVCVTTLTPSAVLGNALSLAGYNSSVAAALGIAVATLSIISWVSVYFAQYGRHLGQRALGVFLRFGGIAFASAGWMWLTLSTLVSATGSSGEPLLSPLFGAMGVWFSMEAASTSRNPFSGARAFQSIFIHEDRSTIERLERRRTLLQNHILEHTPTPPMDVLRARLGWWRRKTQHVSHRA